MSASNRRRDVEMIIDSRRYSGACPCGREHVMETRLAVVEAG